MPRRLYPLNALRGFEASARHLSFVKAAAELHVTPAAVSHQVKRLEAYLGVALFRRHPRGLRLSERGEALLADLRETFLRLDRAMERVAEGEARGGLTISVAPMFAVKWLVPRLQRFGALYPDVDLRVSSSLRPVDFQREDFDAAVRFGRGPYPGLEAVKLFEESVTPLCSARMPQRSRALRDPDDLRHHVLLHDDSMAFDPDAPTWATWLQAVGAKRVDPTRGPRFSQPELALQAAVDGAGVVLGWRYLAADEIAAGRLVQPFELALPLRAAFHLVYPEGSARRPKIAALREWLLQEIAPARR